MLRILFLLSTFSSFLLPGQGQRAVLPQSSYTEYHPLLASDGSTLFFSRQGHPQNRGARDADDVWISYRQADGQWGRPINAPAPLNTDGPDAVVSLGPGGAWLLQFHPAQASAPRVIYREGRGWQGGERLELPGISDWRRVKACYLDVLGHSLLLALDTDHQRTDLFVSQKLADGEWSVPQSLGNKLNTSRSETFPVLAADGKTLYFASDRPGGQGGYDLWMSRRQGNAWNNWTTPINLGTDINGPRDDWHLTLSSTGDYGIFAPLDEDGRRNLQYFNLPADLQPDPVALLTGHCEAITSWDLNPMLELRSVDGTPGTERLPLGADGRYSLALPTGSGVLISAATPGFFSASALVGASAGEQLDQDPNHTLVMAGLSAEYFQRDAAIKLLRQSIADLDQEILELQGRRQAFLTAMRREQREAAQVLLREAPNKPNWMALRAAYDAYWFPEDTIPAERDWQVRSPEVPVQREELEDNIAELEDMKQRFRQHHAREREQAAALANDTVEYLWAAPLSMRELEQRTVEQVAEDALPGVAKQLGENWVTKGGSPEEVRLRGQASEQLRADIQASLRAPAEAPPSPPLPDWQQEYQDQLSAELRPQVREYYTDNLRGQIEAAFQSEQQLQNRQAASDALEEELRQKVLAQIREEEKQGVTGRYEHLEPITTPAETPEDRGYRAYEVDLQLTELAPGRVLVLENLLFHPNESRWMLPAYAELDRVTAFLRDYPQVTVEFRGHTSGDLGHALAMQLSNQRARAVVDYLAAQGIDRSRLSYRGFGKIAPLVEGNGPEDQRRNQRIEMVILSMPER